MKQTIQSGGGGGENDINIYHLIKGKTKTKETQGGSGTKGELMAALVLGQQCTLGNYKHKGKKRNLGLYSNAIVANNGTSARVTKKRRRREREIKEHK